MPASAPVLRDQAAIALDGSFYRDGHAAVQGAAIGTTTRSIYAGQIAP